MKFKKSLLLIFLIIGFIAIASVSADEIDDRTLPMEDNSIGDSEEIISDSPQEDIIAEEEEEVDDSSEDPLIEDDGTFTALQKKILDAEDGATITLDKDYTYDEGFSTRGIQILKDITINGNGHTLNGLSKSRIFLIHYGVIFSNKVTLNNIKFINGNTDLYGGAIFNYGNLTVNNCVFTNNKAKYCGGAINSVGYLNVKNSKFTGNVAGGDAGAVFSFTIDKSVEFFNDLYKDKTPEGKMEFLDNLPLNLSFKYGTDHFWRKSVIFV